MSNPSGRNQQKPPNNPMAWPNGCIGLCCKDFVIDGVEDDDPLKEHLIPLYRQDGWQHYTCEMWDPATRGCKLHEIGKPETCVESGFGCAIDGCQYSLKVNIEKKKEIFENREKSPEVPENP